MSHSKKVNIKYFALLRDQAKVESETHESTSKTYSELYEELKKVHGFTLDSSMIQIAVNDEFIDKNSTIEDGAKVVFIPPVTGG